MLKISGANYDGDWVDGMREGDGIEDIDDERYEGEFQSNERNGYCIWTKDGNRYVGIVLNGLPEGNGVFKWNNGKVYDGEWYARMKAE